MTDSDVLSDWWTKTLLGQKTTSHPVFGSDVQVTVKDDTVELTGSVATPELAEELSQEADSFSGGRPVVNRLVAKGPGSPQHMQTVIAVFPNADRANLVAGEARNWGWRETDGLEVVATRKEARARLAELGKPAKLSASDRDKILEFLGPGKALLIDRLPEDDAFRVISELEGTDAERVMTLPPEPDRVEHPDGSQSA